jgi:hypothetical protein
MAQGSAPATGSPEPTSASRRGGADIGRDAYIERAKRNAEKRFERMDANHDGVLTQEERRAARGKRRQKSPPE